ncbi:phosphoribosyltransferase [Candidatus Beckwithbacteria bacterium]|nr:phosphoribosyltransferase [Candidatus Beckwithbacteria bacterium]
MADILAILKKTKAIITNSHIVLNSGRHTDTYINKDAVYPFTNEVSEIGQMFAKFWQDKTVDCVVGPALGGIILSQWTAYHLSRIKHKTIYSIYTEKTPDNNQIFTRGYDRFIKNKKILLVEDIMTTGGSVKRSIDSVRLAGGNVVGVSAMVNRDSKNVTISSLDVPILQALANIEVASYEEISCPLCKKNIPINTSVGHGKKFLLSK